MTDLRLQPARARGPNHYEVIADDWIVGRIVLSDASPAERPWMWSLDHAFYRGRTPTHGYEATREAAMAALVGGGGSKSPADAANRSPRCRDSGAGGETRWQEGRGCPYLCRT
jgi:hypothetical protein